MARRANTRTRPLVLAAILIIGLQCMVLISSVRQDSRTNSPKASYVTEEATSVIRKKNITAAAPTTLGDRGSSAQEENRVPIASVRTDANKDLLDAEVQEKLRAIGETPFFNTATISDPWKADLFARLDRIRVICGELCQMNTKADIEKHQVQFDDKRLPKVTVPNVNCPAILNARDLDAGDDMAPAIPPEIETYFTINGSCPVIPRKRRKDIYLGGKSDTSLWPTGNVWEEADIEEAIRQVEEGTFKGTYGVGLVNRIRDKLQQVDMKGKSVLVIGSSHPWIEVILLYHGAAKVTTLEYGELIPKHPKLEALTPQQFRERYQNGELEEFDGVVSHSSVEHSGLGRYGDALNPWGDILAVARAWCVTKEGGFLFLGIPTGAECHVFSNWHRGYDSLRWSLVAANWRQVDQTGEELSRNMHESQIGGGHGYIFKKESPV